MSLRAHAATIARHEERDETDALEALDRAAPQPPAAWMDASIAEARERLEALVRSVDHSPSRRLEIEVVQPSILDDGGSYRGGARSVLEPGSLCLRFRARRHPGEVVVLSATLSMLVYAFVVLASIARSTALGVVPAILVVGMLVGWARCLLPTRHELVVRGLTGTLARGGGSPRPIDVGSLHWARESGTSAGPEQILYDNERGPRPWARTAPDEALLVLPALCRAYTDLVRACRASVEARTSRE